MVTNSRRSAGMVLHLGVDPRVEFAQLGCVGLRVRDILSFALRIRLRKASRMVLHVPHHVHRIEPEMRVDVRLALEGAGGQTGGRLDGILAILGRSLMSSSIMGSSPRMSTITILPRHASGIPGGGFEAVRIAACGKERNDREPVAGDPLRDVCHEAGDQYIGGARTLTVSPPSRPQPLRTPPTQPAQAPPRRPATPAARATHALGALCGPPPTSILPRARGERGP